MGLCWCCSPKFVTSGSQGLVPRLAWLFLGTTSGSGGAEHGSVSYSEGPCHLLPFPGREEGSQNTEADNAFRSCNAFPVFNIAFLPPGYSQV